MENLEKKTIKIYESINGLIEIVGDLSYGQAKNILKEKKIMHDNLHWCVVEKPPTNHFWKEIYNGYLVTP